MAAPSFTATDLLPATGHAPGELLWGEAPQRQPIAPLILMAVLVLLVAAPSALAGGGGSSNPITLMRGIADSTWELTGLMKQSNESLDAIDTNSSKLLELQGNMVEIGKATAGMQAKTMKLNATLGQVGVSVHESGTTLQGVDSKLAKTA